MSPPRFISSLKVLGVALPALVVLAGCNVVTSGPEQRVVVKSTPPGAEVTVTDNQDRLVARATTPGYVQLKPKSGVHYTVVFEKPGYQKRAVLVSSQGSGMYPVGLGVSFLAGGLVNPAAGGMFTLDRERVEVVLEPAGR